MHLLGEKARRRVGDGVERVDEERHDVACRHTPLTGLASARATSRCAAVKTCPGWKRDTIRPVDASKQTTEGPTPHAPAAALGLDEAEVPGLMKNRFVYVNVWRNISDTPIQNYPLAVLDGSTCSVEMDFVPQAMIYKMQPILQIVVDNNGQCIGSSYGPGHPSWDKFNQRWQASWSEAGKKKRRMTP